MAVERIEIYERQDGTYDWRLVAKNGEIVATSGGQGFRDRTDAKRAIEFMAEDLPIVDVMSREGMNYDVIDLGNGDEGLGPDENGPESPQNA